MITREKSVGAVVFRRDPVKAPVGAHGASPIKLPLSAHGASPIKVPLSAHGVNSVKAPVDAHGASGKKIKYLLLHYQSGHWDFPKGHVEKDETEIETLRREIEEETGIKELQLISGFRAGTGYFYVARGEERKKRIKEERGLEIKKRVYYYLAETKTKSVRISHEHKGFAWLEYAEALKKITHRNSKNILKMAAKILNCG